MRPHSADFLEYEARAEAAAEAAGLNMMNAIKPDAIRAPRPKSSLDINRTPDSFYYSEASYADKMRKSALYLQHPQAAQQQTPATYKINSEFLSPVGNGMNTIGYENPYERAYKRNELLSETANVAASMPRMNRAGMTGSSSSCQLRSPSAIAAAQTFSPPGNSLYGPAVSTQQIIAQNEQFLRSASARLPKRSSTFDEELSNNAANSSANRNTNSPSQQLDGERKREESMKRLLEWKQRMLQSPLTRKSVQQAASGNSNMTAMSKLGSNPNILLSSTAVASGAHYAHSSRAAAANKKLANPSGGIPVGGVTGIQRSRSETQANLGPTAGYNSYSSDDEGMYAYEIYIKLLL